MALVIFENRTVTAEKQVHFKAERGSTDISKTNNKISQQLQQNSRIVLAEVQSRRIVD